MLKVTVKIPEGLKNGSEIAANEIKLAMDQTTTDVEKEAKKRVPVRTANLQRNIYSDVIPLGGTIKGVVYPNMQAAPYAKAVEYGTGIYSEDPDASKQPITPTTKQALAFMASRGMSRPNSSAGWRSAIKAGNAIIVKSIKGMRAKPYMRPAFEKAKEFATKNFEAAVERMKERMKT